LCREEEQCSRTLYSLLCAHWAFASQCLLVPLFTKTLEAHHCPQTPQRSTDILDPAPWTLDYQEVVQGAGTRALGGFLQHTDMPGWSGLWEAHTCPLKARVSCSSPVEHISH
jgi:hypothetical protein